MSTKHNSRRWKQAVRIFLVSILALDAILLYVNWSATNSAPQSQALEISSLSQKARLFTVDVAQGKSIEKQLPKIGKDCDSFYRRYFLPASSGYSVLVADLSQMARNGGVETGGVNFQETQVKDRDLREVAISASVEGDYQGLIRFLNAMEHSPRFYIIDSLTLASAASGSIKLNLSLRTYFRN